MKNTLPQLFSLVAMLLLFHAGASAQSLSSFLKLNATEVEEQSIYENSKFYFERQLKDKKLQWFDGAIVSKKGVRYDGLQLKFNTIDNSVNLHHDGKFYRVLAGSMSSFLLEGEDGTREFKRGFAEVREHAITASYRCSTVEVLKYLTTYGELGAFKILKLETSKGNSGDGGLDLQLLSNSEILSYRLQSYLSEHEDIFDVKIDIQETGLGESTFFEILAQGELGTLLKFHSRTSSQSAAVSLAKASDAVTFDKFMYYFSDKEGRIQRIYPTKKFVKKALVFAGIGLPRRIPSVRSERKLVGFFQGIL